MRVTVFGATGRTGKELVSQALARGYQVVAYVRNPQKMGLENPQLTIVQGELSDLETIQAAIAGSNCVLSALGPAGDPGDEELSDGVKNILSAMEEAGIKRLIILSTTSAQDPADKESLRTKMRRGMIKRGRPVSYEQIVRYSQLVRDSDLDWTLVRIASILTNKSLSKQISAGYLGIGTFRNILSRADLAWFMLEQAESQEFLRKAPAVSN